jgi:indole-3-glycerol phosphate synthase
MNTLEKIIARKKQEVEERKQQRSITDLEKSVYFEKPNISLKKFLTDPEKTGIIAEFKRKSPSKGIINGQAKVKEVVKGYQEAGASAVSVLTDIDFFGGSDEDLAEARTVLDLPILRKDFIIDEYQIVESKALGANIILLIGAALPAERIKQLSSFSKSLGLEVLLEVHNEQELFACEFDTIDVVGINNRNLKDFSVSIQTSLKLAEIIPNHYLKISESGISDPESILILKRHGFNGFLIGENFMKTENPGASMRKFVRDVLLKSETERKA